MKNSVKKTIAILATILLTLSLASCSSKTIGRVSGAEWEFLVIGNEEYVRVFDSPVSNADKDRFLGNASDGKTVFGVYTVKNDNYAEYLFCTWDYEGIVYRKK